MNKGMSVAISGSPGTGKTTLCILLREQYSVLQLRDLAEQFDCLGQVDPNDDSAPIDIHTLSEKLEFESSEVTFVDGHLSHFLEVDAIVLLRCNPQFLRERLAEREYSEQKISANVEWEMVSGTWSEIHEFEISVPVLEIDTTHSPVEEILQTVVQWIEDKCPSRNQKEQDSSIIDWL